ncbi:MAG: hypothetical protein WBP45_15985 [Daejeonella sp.]
MKKVFTVLTLAAFVGFASAQTQPAKTTAKAETKKECKKGSSCCSKKEKTEKTASVADKTAPKKN